MLLIDAIWPANPWSRPNRTLNPAGAVDVDQPAAACLMVARTALESIGGFDEEFRPAWFEDVDLCRRIRNRGGRIQYQPGARFLHHGGYSLRHLSRQDFLEIFHANQIRYFRKHHGRRTALCVRRLILLGLFLRSALSWVHSPVPHMSRAASARMFWNTARHILRLREAEA
jgi:GT2 family glycosyltransferase